MKNKIKQQQLKQDGFTPPPLNLILKITKPLSNYFTPEFFGIETLHADKPALYIANHTLYGITDFTLFLAEAYQKRAIFLRTLSDNRHYATPGWREIVQYFGMVRGTPDNCAELMRQQKHIMVFPGGGREVFRRKNEKYSLQWKQRTGFARMAIQHGYDIVPVAQVGGDDAYTIISDSRDFQESLIGKFAARAGYLIDEKKAEYIPPLAKGFLGTVFPKPVKLYFSVGERISTSKYNGDISDDNLWEVRNKTELEMTRKMLKLLEYRITDKSVSSLRKILAKI